mgnify:FL=1
MTNKYLLLLSFALIYASNVFCQTEKKWQTYTKDNYTIQYPGDWYQGTPIFSNTKMVIKPNKQEYQFKFSINLVILDVPSNINNIEAYAKFTDQDIKRMMPSGRQLSRKIYRTKSGHYYKHIYTVKQLGQDLIFPTNFII